MTKLYKIEHRLKNRPESKWLASPSFSCMRKSFAEGAWTMLKSHYGGNLEYRLLLNGAVVDEWNSPPVKPQ